MNIAIRLLASLILILSINSPELQTPAAPTARNNTDAQETSVYWLGSIPDKAIQVYDASVSGDSSRLTTVSISPSGQYLAAVDRSRQSMQDRHAAGIGNTLGRLPEEIYLCSRVGRSYWLTKTIPVDKEMQKELSSTLGAGADFTWNEDETRCVISLKWGANSDNMNYIGRYHSNLYLLDIGSGSCRRLTENSEPTEHCALPQWSGADTVRFLRMRNDGGYQNTICEINLATGQETTVAELYNANGAASVILAWQAAGDRIYYSVDGLTRGSGFYVSTVGSLAAFARCLVDIPTALRETNRHPYCRVFSQMDISADGRWACLTVSDQRAINRDIPYADSPDKPQTDPAHAISPISGKPWVPCHNVFLYDLTQNRLVDPFRAAALSPAKVIVTAACFAPDGKSLLCAVFGDQAPWTIAENTRTTFYQIDLTDGRFTANRVFETELRSSLWFPEGLRWTADNTLYIPTGTPPAFPVQVLKLK